MRINTVGIVPVAGGNFTIQNFELNALVLSSFEREFSNMDYITITLQDKKESHVLVQRMSLTDFQAINAITDGQSQRLENIAERSEATTDEFREYRVVKIPLGCVHCKDDTVLQIQIELDRSHETGEIYLSSLSLEKDSDYLLQYRSFREKSFKAPACQELYLKFNANTYDRKETIQVCADNENLVASVHEFFALTNLGSEVQDSDTFCAIYEDDDGVPDIVSVNSFVTAEHTFIAVERKTILHRVAASTKRNAMFAASKVARIEASGKDRAKALQYAGKTIPSAQLMSVARNMKTY